MDAFILNGKPQKRVWGFRLWGKGYKQQAQDFTGGGPPLKR